MKKISYRIISIIVFLSLFVTPGARAAKSPPAQAPSAAPLETVLLQGRVIHAPAEAKVQAFDAEGTLVAEAYAGPQGGFAFEPLQAGEYHLQVVDGLGRRLPTTVDSQAETPLESQAVRREYILRVVTPAGESQTPAGAASKRVISSGSGQITGTVTVAPGGAPLEDASVYAYASKTDYWWDYVASDFTDASGMYALTDLADGSYYLRFAKADYITEYYNDKSSLAEADGVSVVGGGITPGINASLVQGGRITGTVTAAGGGPLESVSVYAYTSKTAEEWDYITYDSTDASGAYALTGLAAGTYYVSFEKTDYFTEYYNDKTSLAAADGVSVTLGSETSSINAALTLGGQITGTVTAATGGALLQGVDVYAYTSKTDKIYDYAFSGSTDVNGVYTITGLTAGTYYLRFEKTDYLIEYYNDKTSLADANGVSVTLGGITPNIDAALTLGGQITGTVTAAAGGGFLQDVYVYVYTSKTAESFEFVAYDSSDASGAYALTGLAAGTYYIEFAKTDYLSEYYNDKTSLAEADGVSVTLGGVIPNINAALSEAGKISGHVTAEENGASLKDVAVTIYTYIQYCGRRQLYMVASDLTDAAGNYTVTSLGTGDYIAKFSPESNGSSAAYLPEYYNNQASLATANLIHVVAGQTTGSIDAALTKGGMITGVVTAVNGGAPLKDVSVDVYTAGFSWAADALTDASGAYTVTGLPTGNYKLDFEPTSSGTSFGYIEEYYNDKPSLDLADQVPVAAGALVSGKNAALALGGQFTGHVTAADGGANLEGVVVEVYDNLWNTKGYGTTNVNGVYTTSGVAGGSYRLKFLPLYGATLDYLAEYYNDKTISTTADFVPISAPGLTTANAVLARGGSISGTVSSSITGSPLEDVDVTLLDVNGVEVGWESTDENGQYLFRGVPTGVYHVHFIFSVCMFDFQTYYHQKPSLATADHVSVTVPSLTPNIDAQLAIPATVTIYECFLPLIER